jgi:hypothetical protein
MSEHDRHKPHPIDEKIERMLGNAARDFRAMPTFETPHAHHHARGCGCQGCRGHCPKCPTGPMGPPGSTGPTGTTGATGATGTGGQELVMISVDDYLALPEDKKRAPLIQWIVYPNRNI